MDRHLKAAVLSLLAIIAILLCITCSRAPTAGTATETENVAAMLYNPGGSPAAHAKVRFYPVNYNPATGGLAKTLTAAPDSTTTDARGNYTAKLDTGTYNILASGDSGVVYQDSITVARDSAIHPPADTLKTPGGIRGRVRLQPGADARTVFILFLGTSTFGTPDDSTGKFTITNMAQGTYKVRILTTLDAYVPKDTVLSVTAGMVDSLAHDIVLQYTGVPGPTGLTVSYDTLRQTVILAWTGADTSLIAGYNVYRTIKGQNFSLITQTPLSDTVTMYRDSTVSVGATYAYMVVSLRAGQESPKVAIPGDTMKVLSSSLVTTTFTWNLNNTIKDTASINDTIKACITFANPTRKIVQIAWNADSLNSPVEKQKSDSSLTGKDTLAQWWKQAGNKKIFVKATDGAGTVWTDSLGVIIVQDIPVISFLSSDTTVNHSGTVRCSVYVQQKFGTMTVEIDTANSGSFKSLGGLGLSGGKACSFSTGNACSWDSVKVRITDDDANVVTKGFKVQVLNIPPVIQKVNPDTTIAIKDSVTFNVLATAPDGSITQVAWDFDGNGVYDFTSSILQTSGYRYQTAGIYKAVLRLTDECQKQTYDTVKITVLQDMPVPNAGADTTASIKDTIKLHGSATHQFGTINEWAWDIGNTGTFKVTSKGDTGIIAPTSESLNYLCVLRVTDSHGNVAKDTVRITVLQDAPIFKFLSSDTVVNHGGTVRCSVYVQQQFGTLTVEIDTTNSGNFKGLGSLGQSGGKAYSLLTGNACSWDSVKIRITDDDGNVVAKGFRVRVRPQPLTITSFDSTVNTITVHYSQSQETDFAQYRIYRNAASAVDTSSELWATISAIGTVSYTTPSPSYSWQPRYYRIYQKDNEGLWSAGSNVVYGNVVNSPPSVPVITYPAKDGDSIWPNDMLRWHPSIDPNGDAVRYKILVNFNNSRYMQLATALTDTSLRLAGCDSVTSLKVKVVALDIFGDSSSWSAERTASIRHTITDIDGNTYQTVTIGLQLWTVENLKTTRYDDGTSIPLVTDNTDWQNLTTPGYCWYNNDSIAYGNTYGALYNWYSINKGILAPAGWHVPTDSEWNVLTTFLGGDSVAGGKLKEAGTLHWSSPNVGATNEAGFSALPGSFRTLFGDFSPIGFYGYWWSSTATLPSNSSLFCAVGYDTTGVYRSSGFKSCGFSVRCVRDP